MTTQLLKSFTISFRKNQFYNIINLLIMSVSMTTVLFIGMYVYFELSYDSFHDHQRVYRAESRLYQNSVATDIWATTTYGHSTAITDNIAGIEESVRVTAQDRQQIVSYQDKFYAEDAYCYTEPSFFKIFNFPIINGDKISPLDRPNTVVVSRSAAARYFGADSPLGKRITFRTPSSEQHFEVTAVIEDMPANSNLRYDFLLSYNTIPIQRQNIWYIHGVYTYLKLAYGTTASQVETAFASISDQYRTKALEHKKWKIELIPLLDIHLTPQKPYEKQTKGNRSGLLVLMIMAVSIMVVSWVNYINLTVAKSMYRVREVLLRRIYGAANSSIFVLLAFEAFITHIVSAIISVLLLFALATPISQVVGSALPFSWFGVILLASITVLGTIFVSFYPACAISNISLVKIMRGNFATSRFANRIRRILVSVQFACSFILICSTATIVWQLKYMSAQPLGVKTENVLIVKYPAFSGDMDAKEDGFRSALLADSRVENVTISGAIPGVEVANYFSLRPLGSDVRDGKLVQILAADKSFINGYQINVVRGCGFDTETETNHNKVIINESCARQLGFVDPYEAAGKMVVIEVLKEPLQIIGVIEDYRQQAFSYDVKPILVILKELMPMIATPYISINFRDRTNVDGLIADVSKLFNNHFSTSPFDYALLDDLYGNQYQSERNFQHILTVAAIVALFTALVGLWIMSLFSLSAQAPQIELRKIYGASRFSLFVLLTTEMFYVSLVSSVIGSVVSYYLMREWLMDYSISVGFQWWILVANSLGLFAVALVTISTRIMKVISRKPSY